MGKYYSLEVAREPRRGDFSDTHEQAEKMRHYINFKIWHKQAMDERDGIRKPSDRPKPPARPSGPPVLRVVQSIERKGHV